MATKRFIVEGEWTGYTSGQRRVVHREVLSRNREAYEAIHAVVYTDGTSLLVRVRDARPREKVEVVRGYSTLLADIVAQGLTGRVLVSQLRSTR